MASVLADRGIRVNCVAPGPVWTPLIPATFEAEHAESFGEQTPMSRAAEHAGLGSGPDDHRGAARSGRLP
jgi:NAD(P)-dependent dehydrogenase (short-subunit alcohol dehydrogenase family)